jgi:hypothetical protein
MTRMTRMTREIAIGTISPTVPYLCAQMHGRYCLATCDDANDAVTHEIAIGTISPTLKPSHVRSSPGVISHLSS